MLHAAIRSSLFLCVIIIFIFLSKNRQKSINLKNQKSPKMVQIYDFQGREHGVVIYAIFLAFFCRNSTRARHCVFSSTYKNPSAHLLPNHKSRLLPNESSEKQRACPKLLHDRLRRKLNDIRFPGDHKRQPKRLGRTDHDATRNKQAPLYASAT